MSTSLGRPAPAVYQPPATPRYLSCPWSLARGFISSQSKILVLPFKAQNQVWRFKVEFQQVANSSANTAVKGSCKTQSQVANINNLIIFLIIFMIMEISARHRARWVPFSNCDTDHVQPSTWPLVSDQYPDNIGNICDTKYILREAGQFDLAPDQYSLHSRPASQTGSYRYLPTDHMDQYHYQLATTWYLLS